MPPPRWLEGVTWTIGLALLTGYGAVRAWEEHLRVEGIETLREMRNSQTPHLHPLVVWQPSSADQSLWSASRVRAFRHSFSRETPEGILRIPSLTLEVPVYGNTGETNLNRGAGHIEGTASLNTPGNVGIAAHRDGFFRKLKDVQLGDSLYLDTRTRAVRYRIVDIRIVNPSDVSVLAATPVPSVTLVTCHPFYFVGPAPQRFVVRAQIDANVSVQRSSSEPADPATQEPVSCQTNHCRLLRRSR